MAKTVAGLVRVQKHVRILKNQLLAKALLRTLSLAALLVKMLIGIEWNQRRLSLYES